MNFFLTKLSLFFLISFVSFFESKGFTKELAKFKDWTAFAEGDGKNLACMAVSKPKKSEGNYTKRGDVLQLLLICQDKKNGMNLVLLQVTTTKLTVTQKS